MKASRAGADIMADNGIDFKYNSYVQDIMGPMCFDYGFGPFRWVCTSGKPEDLAKTDAIPFLLMVLIAFVETFKITVSPVSGTKNFFVYMNLIFGKVLFCEPLFRFIYYM